MAEITKEALERFVVLYFKKAFEEGASIESMQEDILPVVQEMAPEDREPVAVFLVEACRKAVNELLDGKVAVIVHEGVGGGH